MYRKWKEIIILYQLPNGKVVYLTVEEYFALSDEEFNSIVHSNVGDIAPSKPFFGTSTESSQTEQAEDTDKNLDYILEFLIDDDEIRIAPPFDINNISDETSEWYW